jgi:acyl carrier protein
MKPIGTTQEDVKAVLVTTLGLEERSQTLTASTPLLGSLPELDSLAVVQLVLALEEHFGLTIDEDEITAEVFETLGTLSAFIERRLR